MNRVFRNKTGNSTIGREAQIQATNWHGRFREGVEGFSFVGWLVLFFVVVFVCFRFKERTLGRRFFHSAFFHLPSVCQP